MTTLTEERHALVYPLDRFHWDHGRRVMPDLADEELRTGHVDVKDGDRHATFPVGDPKRWAEW